MLYDIIRTFKQQHQVMIAFGILGDSGDAQGKPKAIITQPESAQAALAQS